MAEGILSSQKILDKSEDYDLMKAWLGTGLLISTGKKWHQRRKIITPSFHFQILERFVEVMDDHGKVMVEKLRKLDGQEVDMFPLVNLYALDVICGKFFIRFFIRFLLGVVFTSIELNKKVQRPQFRGWRCQNFQAQA